MTWFLVGWLLLFVAATALGGLIQTQMIDDVERGLPIQRRPSWRPWKIRRIPLAKVRRHREMYPSSGLRKWWVVISVIQAGLVIVPLIAVFVRAIVNGG